MSGSTGSTRCYVRPPLRSPYLTLSTENVLAKHKKAYFRETKDATPTFFDHQVYLKDLTVQTRYGLLIAAPTPLRSPHLTLSSQNVLAEHKMPVLRKPKEPRPPHSTTKSTSRALQCKHVMVS